MRFLPLACLACRALAAALFGLTLAMAAPQAMAQRQPADRVEPNPRLPQVDITAGIHVIRAEVAADGATRARGLMMRRSLGNNEGMLFVFEDKAGHCFWMRNTLIPLSIAFIDDDGTIVNIENMQAHSEDSTCPKRPVRYALEMEQGWFARRGVAAGTRLVQPRLFGSAGR